MGMRSDVYEKSEITNCSIYAVDVYKQESANSCLPVFFMFAMNSLLNCTNTFHILSTK